MNKYEDCELIAEWMGGVVTHVEEYEAPHGSHSDIKIKHWRLPEGIPSGDYYASIGHFRYDKSWDWLMPVIRKINGLGKEYSFAIFKTYVAMSVEKSGKMYKDFSFAHSEYITGEQTDIQAAFKLVVKFINWEKERGK